MIGGPFAAALARTALPPALERSAARDTAVIALESSWPARWSPEALRSAAGPQADLLFPRGAPEIAEYAFDLGDRLLAATCDVSGIGRISGRVRALTLARLDLMHAGGEGPRRALAALQQPWAARFFARAVLRSADAIWTHADPEGDGMAFVTRRLTLAGILGPLLLYWQARADDRPALESYLDRRLAEVRAIGRVRARLSGRAA